MKEKREKSETSKNSDKAPAVLLCGHGSRSPQAAAEFHHLVEKLQRRLAGQTVSGGFLEFNRPTIAHGLRDLYDRGHRDMIVQPLTLYNAGHTRRDIPDILQDFRRDHPDARLRYGAALGLSPPVIDAAVQAIRSVLPDGDPEDFKLLVVGRGSPERAVADQTINLCRKLHQRLDFGDSRYCYSFGGAPLLAKGLRHAARSHYHQVVVLPVLLFSGRLLSDIYREIDRASAEYPAFTFHKAPHLGAQEAIIDAISDAIRQTDKSG